MRMCVASSLVLAIASAVSAQTTLTATMTADNAFTASISTSPTIEGAPFLAGANWGQVFNGSVDLTEAGTYYLHITAQDFGPPMMLIGLFTLSNTEATFQNGTQTLVTNTTDWLVSDTGYANPGVTPADLGANGSAWANFTAIGPDAHFIWHPGAPSTAYFTTVITVVPAPATLLPLASLGLVALRRRR